ncbi:MAG TPA: hypothetical protein VK188_17925, partial [Holophaga sp.]|nr:hypothetical protein [Holophaga sp.]
PPPPGSALAEPLAEPGLPRRPGIVPAAVFHLAAGLMLAATFFMKTSTSSGCGGALLPPLFLIPGVLLLLRDHEESGRRMSLWVTAFASVCCLIFLGVIVRERPSLGLVYVCTMTWVATPWFWLFRNRPGDHKPRRTWLGWGWLSLSILVLVAVTSAVQHRLRASAKPTAPPQAPAYRKVGSTPLRLLLEDELKDKAIPPVKAPGIREVDYHYLDAGTTSVMVYHFAFGPGMVLQARKGGEGMIQDLEKIAGVKAGQVAYRPARRSDLEGALFTFSMDSPKLGGLYHFQQFVFGRKDPITGQLHGWCLFVGSTRGEDAARERADRVFDTMLFQ